MPLDYFSWIRDRRQINGPIPDQQEAQVFANLNYLLFGWSDAERR
jgi:hypothetical protein